MSVTLLPTKQGAAPYLKGPTYLFRLLGLEIGAALIFWLAGCAAGGLTKALSGALLLSFCGAVLVLLRLAGRPRSFVYSGTLFTQALLCAVFLPAGLSMAENAGAAAVLTFIYTFSGGRTAFVLHPAAWTFAMMYLAGVSLDFPLLNVTPKLSTVALLGWACLRFPRKKIDFLRWILICAGAFAIAKSQDVLFLNAFVFSAAAGELIYDRALMPLTARGSFSTMLFSGILFFGLAATLNWQAALAVGGLAAGFFAAAMEENELMRASR